MNRSSHNSRSSHKRDNRSHQHRQDRHDSPEPSRDTNRSNGSIQRIEMIQFSRSPSTSQRNQNHHQRHVPGHSSRSMNYSHGVNPIHGQQHTRPPHHSAGFSALWGTMPPPQAPPPLILPPLMGRHHGHPVDRRRSRSEIPPLCPELRPKRRRASSLGRCRRGVDEDEPCKLIKDWFSPAMRRMLSRPWEFNELLRKLPLPYKSKFVKGLFYNKHVLFIGDSLTRGLYKDFVALLHGDSAVPPHMLKKKMEHTYMHDRLIDDAPLDSDRIFKQAREYQDSGHLVQYLFTTRVTKQHVEKALLQMVEKNEYPDVIFINSCLWDITRYYKTSVNMKNIPIYAAFPQAQIDNELEAMKEYIERLSSLMSYLRAVLPPGRKTQVIWITMPWGMQDGRNALTGRADTSKQRTLHRTVVADANYRAAQVVASSGYDVLDLCYYLRSHIFYPLRTADGIHWDPVGTRLMNQLLVGHVAKNLGKGLPKEYEEILKKLGKNIKASCFYEQMNTNTPQVGQAKPHKGAYFLPLQRKLNQKVFQTMPIKEAVAKDIQLGRTVQILEQRKLELSEEDCKRVEDMSLQFPQTSRALGLQPTSNRVEKKAKRRLQKK